MKTTISAHPLGTALSLSASGLALVQDKTVKIGALSDQSGLYADLGGNPRDGVKIVEKMKSMATEDDLFGRGAIQPNGRTVHDASVRSEEALGIQSTVGLLQAGLHGAGRSGLHVRKHVRASEEVTIMTRRP